MWGHMWGKNKNSYRRRRYWVIDSGPRHHHLVKYRLQYTLHLGDSIFAFWRQSINRDQSIFCTSNISSQCQLVNLRDINLINTAEWHDLISVRIYKNICALLKLDPYQVLWISN